MCTAQGEDWEINRLPYINNDSTSVFTPNGILFVKVLVPLTVASSGAFISLLVYVRGSPNLFFANPTTDLMNSWTLASGVGSKSLANGCKIPPSVFDAPAGTPGFMTPVEHCMLYGRTVPAAILGRYSGEVITSARTLMRKYVPFLFHIPAGSPTNVDFTTSQAQFFMTVPFPTGPVTRKANDGFVNLNTLSFWQWSYASWVCASFGATSGSNRYKVFCNDNSTNVDARVFSVGLNKINTDCQNMAYTNSATVNAVIPGANSREASAGRSSGLSGAADRVLGRGVLEFEIPQLSNDRFTYVENNGGVDSSLNSADASLYYYARVVTPVSIGLEFFQAVGEDFTAYIYNGPPQIVFEPLPLPEFQKGYA